MSTAATLRNITLPRIAPVTALADREVPARRLSAGPQLSSGSSLTSSMPKPDRPT
jgi:hypothetical protein